MSRVCAYCHQEIADSREWNGLLLRGGQVFWCGQRCPHLTAGVYRILWTLAGSGEASRDAFDSETASHNHLKVAVHYLRTWLRDCRIPVEIINIHGQGYRLELGETP